jgi:hypothetical protein
MNVGVHVAGLIQGPGGLVFMFIAALVRKCLGRPPECVI